MGPGGKRGTLGRMSRDVEQATDGTLAPASGDASARAPSRCGIAARRGREVECPPGGCALLIALGYEQPSSPDETCPVEAIAQHAGFDASVVRTLDELRAELERSGVTLSLARAYRSRVARHDGAIRRWPEVS